MSTAKKLKEFERSWSEENLFQTQIQQKVKDLEAEVTKLSSEKTSLAESNTDAAKEIEDLKAEVHKLRVKCYDAEHALESNAKPARHKKSKKTKRAKKPPGFKAQKKPLDKRELKAAKEREEQAKKEADAIGKLEAILTHDEQRSGSATHEESDEIELELIGRDFPDLRIGAVLQAEQRFVEADEDGSGLIDDDELDKVLDGLSLTKTKIDEITKKLKINKKNGLNFYNCVQILHELERENSVKRRISTFDGQGVSSKACAIQ